MTPTPAQIDILWHALGLDEQRPAPWRNYYSTSADDPQLLAMVTAGWMDGPHMRCGAPLFTVTPEGRRVALEMRPKPPKVSRSKERYRRFLREDSGLLGRCPMNTELVTAVAEAYQGQPVASMPEPWHRAWWAAILSQPRDVTDLWRSFQIHWQHVDWDFGAVWRSLKVGERKRWELAFDALKDRAPLPFLAHWGMDPIWGWRWQAIRDERCPVLVVLQSAGNEYSHNWTLLYYPDDCHDNKGLSACETNDPEDLARAVVEWKAKVSRESDPPPLARAKECWGSRKNAGYHDPAPCRRCWRCRGEPKPTQAAKVEAVPGAAEGVR